ncbi:NAD-dependent epimerase/dehydratase family protein [Litorilinea aerophila]|uniref:NAD-dependent epimerase/dehydratase family protein n=1 Tax=Litorilinea aerophila TaxID=1204385 RepID=A0A540VFE8_9CHLR|nr:NAD-dependent epimerase/dehydratase family protein [Litorilinea aerophila]MCC9076783.1 NAD-dependent epimerase/dehydratase family protein [Litorilinea aerophila]GIV76514.1 MAG: UDP-glucose 4-epimerase [Litorilinea sp.]
MAKVLVTGGAGFIGSHVAEALVNAGYDVVVLDDLSGGFVDNLVPGVRFIQGSITDVQLVEELFAQERFDYVFHLAAYAAEGLSHFIKRFNYTNNLMGSINLINAAINTDVKCFVFTSSIAVYGTSPELPMTEETPAHPEDPYGIAKLAVEQELAICKEMFDLNYIIFRPHNVYGERQNIGDKYRNVVGIFMNQILQGKPMTVFGDGSQERAFTYIGDVAPIIARSIEVPAAYNQVFNIGADRPYTINQLAHAVAEAMGVPPDIVYVPARNEVVAAYSSHDKVERIFGVAPQYSLEEGIGRMAAWVRQHGARASQEFEGIEVTKNFPKAWAIPSPSAVNGA